MGRLGRPNDIAALVSFLVRDEASFITGQHLSCIRLIFIADDSDTADRTNCELVHLKITFQGLKSIKIVADGGRHYFD